ncbi:hypothetical protein SNE40_011996 [Patella caerulea]|uniref:Amino acid transporter n=1 Tax=Patella caerulea TaxID=87958 RepID=A0AAN8JNW7_PATCE
MKAGELYENPEYLTKGEKVKRLFRKNSLLVFLICALICGIALGAGLRYVEPKFTARQVLYLGYPGELLMNMLKMLILPLVVSSLVSGMASLDARASGVMGLRAVVYYIATTLSAVILGIILVVVIEPGKKGGAPDNIGSPKGKIDPVDTFLDLLRQAFPSNLIEACFRKPLTEQVLDEETLKVRDEMMNTTMTTTLSTLAANLSNITQPELEDIYKPVVTKVEGMNVLGLAVFSIALGITIIKLGEKGKPLKDLFDSLNEATMKLIYVVIWYSPIGVMFLVAAKVVEMDDPEKTFQQLAYYFLTVMAGLTIHGFVTLPLIYFLFVRKNPFKFIYGVLEAIVTALGTASSSATLPVTLKCLEENNGVDPRVCKFVAPVGATINMDGTALYEAVAVIFIGQVRNLDLGIGNVITVSITATAAAIGAAGVPQAGLVTMVIVLTAVGFPTEDVTLILAIDWLVDRFRTAINVLGDAFGAGIVAHLSKKGLEKMDASDESLWKENGEINGVITHAHDNGSFGLDDTKM